MLLVSWNVAGLKPLLEKIHADYGPSSRGSRSSNDNDAVAKSATSVHTSAASDDALSTYLRRHGSPSILCLQEHKIPLAQLSSRSEPRRCATAVAGYESFWSCATSAKSRGFNGVVTYVREGLVRGADCAPFGDPELDDQGRCVATDHGEFVLFNVYVPCSQDAAALTRKMKFLNALQVAMKKQRDGGKRVMLVGDLNLKIDRRDIYWKHRCLNVGEVLDQTRDCDATKLEAFSKWKRDVASKWEEIATVLQTIEAMPRQTMNPTTKKTFNKFIARVKLGENKHVTLGGPEETADDALDCYNMKAQTYVDPASGEDRVYRKKDTVTVEILTELMAKVARVAWDEATQREVAESREAGLNPDSPGHRWMKARLEEDGMADAFRELYPTAEARFTCWNQRQNRRYANEGGRIDFTLVDGALLRRVAQPDGGSALRCGREGTPRADPLGEEAALRAATADGRFAGGTYAGGGIAGATRRALDTQFVGAPHTGMVYTPPGYSDHIAVSLRMEAGFEEEQAGRGLALSHGAATRRAQPHKRQRSIASFFGAGARAGSEKSSAPAAAAVTAGGKRSISREAAAGAVAKKKSLRSYFGGPEKEIGGSSRSGKSSVSGSNKSSHNTSHFPKNSVLKHFGKK